MKAMKKTSGKKFPAVNKVIPKMKNTSKSKESKNKLALSNAQKRLDHLEATKNIHLPL
jgi:hypothetical protein